MRKGIMMFRKPAIFLSVLLLGSPTVLAGTATTYPSTWDKSQLGTPLPAAIKTATPVFDEQFKTLSIGPEDAKDVMWYAPIHSKLGVGQMADAADRAAISVDDKGLLLQTRDPGEKTGVDINLQTMNNAGLGFAMQNGYFEVNANLPIAHGNHAGAWLLSQIGEQGHGEIDIVESYGIGDPHVHSSVHWWPIPDQSRFAKHVFLAKGLYKPDSQYTGSFHDFGVLLTPENIIFYFDQKETRRVARLPEQQVPFYLLLSDFTDAKRPEGYEPAIMRVARVRAWESPATSSVK